MGIFDNIFDLNGDGKVTVSEEITAYNTVTETDGLFNEDYKEIKEENIF